MHIHNLGDFSAVVGFANEDEVRILVEVARSYRPISEPEEEQLLREGRNLAESRAE